MNTKVAIPTRNGKVYEQFGHCDYFTIYSIEWGKIMREEYFKMPEDCENDTNVPFLLAQKDVKVVLAGKIGIDEAELLIFHGIKVFWNCSGNVKEIINKYLNSELSDLEWKDKGFCRISKS